MFKCVFRLFKKVLFNVLFLYSFNLIVSPIGLIVPINLITVSSLTVLGLPALFALILISFIVF